MSNSSRKDFDVKHILRLRWKLFSHPAAPSGGCLQQDSSFEHWGPSQSRLLKSQERSSGAFWKKSSSSSSSNNSASSSSTLLNGTLLPTTRLHALAEPPPRTVFYVESLEHRAGGLGEITRTPQQDTQGVKEEPPPFLDGGGGQATGEGAAHRYWHCAAGRGAAKHFPGVGATRCSGEAMGGSLGVG